MERRDNRRSINLGERFKTNNNGELQVIGWCEGGKYLVRFLSTGFTTIVKSDKIRLGIVKDKLRPRVYGVGYIGNGIYSSKNEPILYLRWKKMLARCYSNSYPHYVGCTVCDRWLDFQNFVSDAKNLPNYSDDLNGMDLDKDSIVVGNRIYSPATCQFLTRAENFRYALNRW
ncbi:hypothetical protein ACED16_02605 [Enterobacter hormaechei]